VIGMLERMPVVAGYATLAIGAVLVVAPRLVTGAVGLDGQEAAVRAIGVSDLVLVPGLLRGSPRWPWMLTRAVFNLGDAAYLQRVANRSSTPAALTAGAAAMAALTALDGAAALALRPR
jgi:hypothetical protein